MCKTREAMHEKRGTLNKPRQNTRLEEHFIIRETMHEIEIYYTRQRTRLDKQFYKTRETMYAIRDARNKTIYKARETLYKT